MNQNQIKETIKEMFEDGTIEIEPRYVNLQVEIIVKIDGEEVQRRYG